MTDAVVASLLTRCYDPGDSAGKIGKPGVRLAELGDDQLYDYMRPWHSTLADTSGIVLYDELPESFLARWNTDRCRFVRYPYDANENAWVVRYRMLEQLLTEHSLDRVLLTDINDVAFASNPFTWLDSWNLPPQLLFGEELCPYGRNGWFSGDALKQMPPDIAFWFRSAPETKPLSAGLWGGPAADVLAFCRQLNALFDQHADLRRQHRNVAWDMVLLNHLAYTTLGRFATFGMHLAKLPHYMAGITLRWQENPNPLEHNTQRSRAVANGIVRWNRGSPSSWEEIPSHWFDFAKIYDEALDRAYLPSVFVEVGSWLGKSTAYMAQEIRRRQRKVKFYAVDTWKGSYNQAEMMVMVADHGGDVFPEFQQNMDRCNVLEYVTPIRLESVEAAKQFADQSLDFCFIDANHGYEEVSADIRAWKPKMKPNSVLAGHDYGMDGVNRAVNELCPRHRHWGGCWIVDYRC